MLCYTLKQHENKSKSQFNATLKNNISHCYMIYEKGIIISIFLSVLGFDPLSLMKREKRSKRRYESEQTIKQQILIHIVRKKVNLNKYILNVVDIRVFVSCEL